MLALREPSLITIADHSHVLVVVAVVDAPSVAPALAQCRLLALAVHVVQEDGPTPLPEGHGCRQGDGMAAAQLPTHNVGIYDVPVIVTHCAPRAVVEDLHAALAPAGPVGQAQFCKDGPAQSFSGQLGGQHPASNGPTAFGWPGAILHQISALWTKWVTPGYGKLSALVLVNTTSA